MSGVEIKGAKGCYQKHDIYSFNVYLNQRVGISLIFFNCRVFVVRFWYDLEVSFHHRSCKFMRRVTLKSKIKSKISRSRREVFLRSDFKKLAGYDQIGRALRELTSEGILLKIGYGLYAKARLNRLTGKPMLSANGGFAQVAKEAVSRLGVNWKPSESETAYAAGSTQIPSNAEVIVFDRFSRKIGTDNFGLRIIRA